MSLLQQEFLFLKLKDSEIFSENFANHKNQKNKFQYETSLRGTKQSHKYTEKLQTDCTLRSQ